MKTIFQITTSAYNEIIKKIGSKTAEQGGVLMGKDGIITDFIHDKHAKTTGGTYQLNTPYLNPLIKNLIAQGKEFLGILHSHPIGYGQLSAQDKSYFKSQFKNFEGLEKMYTPIVFSAKDGEFHFYPYVFHKNGRIEEARLEIVPDNYAKYLTKKVGNALKEAVESAQKKPQTEVIKTEKEVVINLHNKITQKGELEPVVIYVEREQEEKKEEPIEDAVISLTEEEPLKRALFNQIYHGFLIAFLLFIFVLTLFLSPSIYHFFVELLNQ